MKHPIRSEHRCPPSVTLVLLYWALADILIAVVLYIALTH